MITTEMRLLFSHRTNTRVSFRFKSPLSHERTRVGGTQTAVARVYLQGIYATECVPLGSTDTFHKEEGWYDVDVHRLLPT